VKISLKYGFLGLGMGGTSIAHACASVRMKDNYRPYKAILINTNEIDLRKLLNLPNMTKKILRGHEKGVARDIEKGQEAFLEHKEDIIKLIESEFFDREFVFICCGLGGGTGTGAVIEAARMLHQNGFANRFGLILTLPRLTEGRTVLDNALQRLQLIQKAMRGLGSIIIVDNEKLYQEYLQTNPDRAIGDFMRYCNQTVAKLLHEVNTVTASFHPLGTYHFDSSELLKMFQRSGCITFGKCELPETAVNPNMPDSYILPIRQSIGVLSDGYDLQKATAAAISMTASPKGAKRIFTMTMLDTITQLVDASVLDESPVAIYADEHTNQLTVYTMFAGLSLPKRVLQLAEAVQNHGQEEQDDEVALALEGYQKKRQEEKADLDALLDEPAPEKKPKEIGDPFSFLN
jgi:cell division GTPase FtsZ